MQIKMPIPRLGVPGDKPHYPFARLNVGDQILVPFQRSGLTTLANVVRKRKAKFPNEAYRLSPAENGMDSLIIRIA